MQQMKTFWVCAGRFGPDWCADWLLHHEALQVYMQWGATHLSMSSFVFCLIWSLNAKILTSFLNLFSLCHYLCMCCILASGIVLLKLCTDDVFNCRDSTTLSMKQQYWNMFLTLLGDHILGIGIGLSAHCEAWQCDWAPTAFFARYSSSHVESSKDATVILSLIQAWEDRNPFELLYPWDLYSVTLSMVQNLAGDSNTSVCHKHLKFCLPASVLVGWTKPR
jgi:hypothetical protein